MMSIKLYFLVTVHGDKIVGAVDGPFISYDKADSIKDLMPDEMLGSTRIAEVTIPYMYSKLV